MSEKKKPITIPAFEGKKVYLRPLTADDIVSVQMWRIQSDLTALSCRPIPITSPADAAERYKKAEPSIERQYFAVVRNADNMLVGSTSYFDYNSQNRSAELGLIIDPDEQKNGYGTEALYLLCGYLFKFRGLNKVYAQTGGFNKPTIKLLEGLHFKKDATLRDHYFHNGEYFDGLIYSLLSFEFD